MPKPGVYRSPWRDFPDVVIQTTVTKLRSRPGYDQAKHGAGDAAYHAVQELINPEKILFAFDTVVPVMQFDRDKPNALPIVYATALAKHFDAYLETGVRQINVVSHTFADVQTRILGQPMFMGKIQPGSRVLIVDDVVTYGSTLANLRGWLQQAGAHSMSSSRYLRALGLALPIQSTIDHRAVLDLLKINADLGRLGGLIKMWLSSDQSFEFGSAQALQRKLDGTLNQIRALQKQMRDRIQDL
jgi:hypothetical protein